MALITQFLRVRTERSSKHKPVTCGWREVTVDAEKLLQLDTYGTTERVIPDKVSQSFQLDRKAAAHLRQIIDDVFPEAVSQTGRAGV